MKSKRNKIKTGKAKRTSSHCLYIITTMKFLQDERGISEVQILGKTTTRVKADLRHRNKLLKQTETYEE